MKFIYISIFVFISIAGMQMKGNALPLHFTDTPKDTVYISIKDDHKVNRIESRGTYPTVYSVFGFVRAGKPQDYFDSSGRKGMVIHVDTSFFATCAASCRQYIVSRSINLLDLRDSLKTYTDIKWFRKNPHAVFDRFTPNSFMANENRVLVLVQEIKGVYYLRRVANIYYFYLASDE